MALVTLDFKNWFFEEIVKKAAWGAFWISPRGEILSDFTRHIDPIHENPERFGWTGEEMASVYEKHDETPAQDGHARDEIMTRSMNNGWIRIRQYHGPDFWSVESGQVNGSVRRRITNWVLEMMTAGYSPHEEFHLHGLGGPTQTSTFGGWVKEAA